MFLQIPLKLTTQGHELDTSPECFGELRRSDDFISDLPALLERMRTDGYLYLPGYLDRKEVLDARRELTVRLAAKGFLDPRFPAMEAVAAENTQSPWGIGLEVANHPLSKVLYSGRLMEFFSTFLQGPVLHFTYTWMRSIAPGKGTPAHCDIVYMGRGTKDLYTAWVPYGDVSFEMGGLMILEGSHLNERLREGYCQKDVDSYCSNKEDAADYASGQKWWDGQLSHNPPSLRNGMGGRWLTAEYKAGDVVVFGMNTVHCSLDNQSKAFRLSTDSRYQLASEPADERWIGENPVGHGPGGKRGRIC